MSTSKRFIEVNDITPERGYAGYQVNHENEIISHVFIDTGNAIISNGADYDKAAAAFAYMTINNHSLETLMEHPVGFIDLDRGVELLKNLMEKEMIEANPHEIETALESPEECDSSSRFVRILSKVISSAGGASEFLPDSVRKRMAETNFHGKKLLLSTCLLTQLVSVGCTSIVDVWTKGGERRERGERMALYESNNQDEMNLDDSKSVDSWLKKLKKKQLNQPEVDEVFSSLLRKTLSGSDSSEKIVNEIIASSYFSLEKAEDALYFIRENLGSKDKYNYNEQISLLGKLAKSAVATASFKSQCADYALLLSDSNSTLGKCNVLGESSLVPYITDAQTLQKYVSDCDHLPAFKPFAKVFKNRLQELTGESAGKMAKK